LAKFGAGSGPTNVVTRLPQLRPAYFFRRQFVVNSSELEELLLGATCTDASASAIYPLQVFFNGVEVKTSIDTVTGQGNETRYFDLTPFNSMLHAGTNTIAIQIGNCWSDYDDVAFDICLKGVACRSQIPRVALQCSDSGPPMVGVQAPTGTIWQLESSKSVGPGDWQLIRTFTNASATMQFFQDHAPNSLDSTQTRSRFYRLVPY
jgi:hypothetical protein